ncbi:nuclear transcription factor Y subunit B-1-like [Aristolochia californica]|uniref:nuclear transcription factor Y subunit B-1-like n=1 Tax=Aristolochia californica TaxID=171875 RepID=UPI0035E00DA4
MTGSRQRNRSPVGSPPSDTESRVVSDPSSKEQDRFLPIANVSRIMKKSLPANAKISKEAKETVQECVSEFISFITGEASDKCQREKRKTINGDDLLWAMTTLGFENYVGPLKAYLNRYRETEGEKNAMARQGDQSPSDEVQNTTGYFGGKTVANSDVNVMGATSSFNGGFCSGGLDELSGGRVMGYGENSKMGGFHIGETTDYGVGNGARSISTHHRVPW